MTEYKGSVSVTSEEAVVVEITGQLGSYVVEGWIDLAGLTDGVVRIREYVAVDGENYRLYDYMDYDSSLDAPAVRLGPMTLCGFMKYKATIQLLSGSSFEAKYGFVTRVVEVASNIYDLVNLLPSIVLPVALGGIYMSLLRSMG